MASSPTCMRFGPGRRFSTKTMESVRNCIECDACMDCYPYGLLPIKSRIQEFLALSDLHHQESPEKAD